MVVWIICMVSIWVVGGWGSGWVGYGYIGSSRGNFVGTGIIVMEGYLYLDILTKINGYYYYPWYVVGMMWICSIIYSILV